MESIGRTGGGRGYDIFPRTFKARALLALAFALGLGLAGAYLTVWIAVVTGSDLPGLDLFDRMDVTIENRTREPVTVYTNGFERATVEPYEAVTITEFNLSWKWGGDLRIETDNEVLFEENLDLDDLEEMDFRIVIEDESSDLPALPPCSTDDEREACRAPQTELLPDSQAACEGVGDRVCFVPLGQIDSDLVRNLVQYYRDQYGLEIGILTPSEAPWQFISPDRDQVESESLAGFMDTLFPEDFANPEVALIGLTPLDMYEWDRDWRFEMGFADSSEQPRGVVSTYRLHLGTWGLTDDQRVEERTRKIVTKYVGLLHYGLPLSDDPTSPMYNHVLSVSDLDRMGEPLPVP